MFLLNFIVDLFYDGYRWFHAVANTVYGVNLPFVDRLLRWIAARIEDVASTLRQISDAFEEITDWFDLVHDIALRVIDILDVDEWLKRVLSLTSVTLGGLTLRLLDAFRFAFTATPRLADAFVDALLPALKRALSFIDLASDAFKWAIIRLISDVFKPGIGLFDDIVESIWHEISSVGGPFLDWLIDNADWFYDTLLNVTTRIAFHIAANAKDFIELILDLPEWLLNETLEGAEWTGNIVSQGLWGLLDIIVNKTVDFVRAVATGVSSHLDDVAQPIVDLGELILDYVWGEE